MEDKEETLANHLKALRKALIKSFICIAVFLPFCLWLSPKALDFFISVVTRDVKIALNYFAPMEVFVLQIKIAAFMSLALSFPFIAKNIWSFILPALYDKERRFIGSITLSSALLFCSGVLFCFFGILPLIINFGMSFSSPGIQAIFGISNIINLSLNLCIVFGIMFQFPLVTYSLIRSEIVSYESVKSKRSYIVVGILIIAALLTPPDIISQLTLAAPTYLLFELGLLFARGIKKRHPEITEPPESQ